MTSVAVLGMGRMGSAMAGAIARAGHDLIVYNRTQERAQALAVELGGRCVRTPAEAAAESDITITMLSDDSAVREVFLGSNGLAAGAHAGGVLVDMSTVMPATIRSVEAAVRATGSGLLDAPVSGSVSLANGGQLTVMVGGEAADLELARAGLEALAKTIFHLGPLGSGAAMKLAVNTVIFGLNGALAEGLVLAEAAGVERALAYDVIAGGAAGAPYVAYKEAAFLDPLGTPVAFALTLADKDLRLILESAARLGVELPQTRASHQLIREAVSHGLADDDFSAIAVELRSRRRIQSPEGSQLEEASD